MFASELEIKPVNGDEWELTQPLEYMTWDGIYIIVPEGFQMDLASIPRIFTWLFPVHGKHTRAAVVHDWLYHIRGHMKGVYKLSRKECDEIFLQSMAELGVGAFKRYSMYYAVRTGGWWAWRK